MTERTLLVSALFVLGVACGSGDPFSGSSGSQGGGGQNGEQSPGGAGAGASTSNGTAGAHASGGVASGGDAGSGGDPNPNTEGGHTSAGGEAASGNGGNGGDGDGDGELTCAAPCRDPAPYCAKVNGMATCVNPAHALSGKRLELPCVGSDDVVTQLCPSIADRTHACPVGGKSITQTIVLGGDPSALYSITLRIRGVVEPRSYVGGKDAGNHFYIGGTGQQPSNYDTFGIVVSSPAQTFYLNADTTPESYRLFKLDHQKAIVVHGGASITLQVNDPDCAMVRNCQSFSTATCAPYVIAGVPPDPMAYNGQFVQLDVVSVTLAP